MSLPSIKEFDKFDTVEVYVSHSHRTHRWFLYMAHCNGVQDDPEYWDSLSRY